MLARHDPLRCAKSAKRSQRRKGQDGRSAVRFRGNEVLELVAVGGVKVRLVVTKPTTKQQPPSTADRQLAFLSCMHTERVVRGNGSDLDIMSAANHA